MAKISVIGICGNSVFMRVDRFHEQGETLTAKNLHMEIGGKGINQAVAAARMGAEVSFLAAVGNDDAAIACENMLKQNRIHAFLQKKHGKQTTTAYILTDQSGENRVTVYRDAELMSEDVLLFESEIAKSDVLLLQQEVLPEVNRMAIKLANKHGVKVILNPAPARALAVEDAEAVWLLTPNEHESRALHGSNIQNCITTLGNRGCCINGKIKIPACRVHAIDTTGAGDTFNGVLAVCLAEGMCFVDAAEYAVTASGISVTRPYVLNAIPHRDEIERNLKK